MAADDDKPFIQVHHRGDRGVDGILRLIELASHDGPIETMLTAMCDQVAAITGVDIASIYVAEDEQLVIRGNHGFDRAIGTALQVGEGITGLVAECMRPISASNQSTEASFKRVPGLDEDYPVFVGVPLISGSTTIGVLVMQRKTTPFAVAEVTLATALGAPITLAIERRRASALRSARLNGRGHGGGVVLGRAGAIPTTTAITAPNEQELERALGRIRDDMSRAVKRLKHADDDQIGAALDRVSLGLLDQRLHEKLLEGAGAIGGLRNVSKEYARAAHRLGTESDEQDQIEELCVLIGITADQRSSVRPGAIWIADKLGAVMAIGAVARGAGAIVTSQKASSAALAICNAAQLPIVTDVAGLFGWARPGDLIAVDGSSGTVLVHPSPSDIDKLRRARDAGQPPESDPSG
ncbi:MAG: GAF domain-containing protein [Kofleriaceae bacterium]